MELPEELELLYRLTNFYDEAPERANELLGRVIGDSEAIKNLYSGILGSNDNQDEMMRNVAAVNSALVKTHIQSGNLRAARATIRVLTTRETLFVEYDSLLSNAGILFEDECIRAKRLLTPTEITDIVLERHTAEPHAFDYLSKDGWAVVIDSGSGYTASAFSDNSGKIIHAGRQADLCGVRLNLEDEINIKIDAKILNASSTDGMHEKIKRAFDEDGIRDYSVIHLSEIEAFNFLAYRYTVEHAGGFFHNHTPIKGSARQRLVIFNDNYA